MRLREIQWILESVVPKLPLQVVRTRHTAQGTPFETITPVHDVRDGLAQLLHVAAFHNRAKAILLHQVFTSGYNETELRQDESRTLVQAVTELTAEVEALVVTLRQVLPPESPDAFYFHIPVPGALSVEVLEEKIRNIRSIFEQPLRRLSNSEISIRTADSGSIVLEIITTISNAAETLGTSPIAVVVALSHAAKEIVKLKLLYDRERAVTEGLKLDNEHKELENKLLELKVAAQIEQKSKEVAAQFPETNKENVHILVGHSVALLSEEMLNGSKIMLPANVPQAIADTADPELLPPTAVLNPASEHTITKHLLPDPKDFQKD